MRRRTHATLALVAMLLVTVTVVAYWALGAPSDVTAPHRPPRSGNGPRRPRPAPPAGAPPRAPAAPAPPRGRPGGQTASLTAAWLRVSFLAIGQGDAALLQTADGHAAMIDTGPPDGRAELRAALQRHGVARLDWLMLSHPHVDHVGGASEVLDAVPVDRVVDPALPHPIATYARLLDRISALALPFVRARGGLQLTLGARVAVDLLQPSEPLLERTRSDLNANSIVARVQAGGVRILFTGDAEHETEERLLRDDPDRLAADVLKVAHHGSRFASGEAFLSAVAPRYAVISCGAGNDYGHPHGPTLAALARHNVNFFRTDLQGEIALSTDGATVELTPAQPADPAAMATPGVGQGAHPNER